MKKEGRAIMAMFCMIFYCGTVVPCCSPALTPAQETSIEHHEETLSGCRQRAEQARAADASPQDSYAVYEACKKDGGIK